MKRPICCLLAILFCLLTAGCFFQPAPVSDTRFAMDTVITILAAGKGERQVKQAMNDAFQVFQEVADETDRYQNTGLASVYALNLHAGKGPLPVGRHVFTLLDFLRRQPHPDVDATIGPVVDCWRQHSKTKTLPTADELEAALRITGRHNLVLHPSEQAAELLQPGMSLDLGAVAKGYAVDQAAQYLAQAGISYALVNAGGNIKTIGQKPDQDDWRIAIQHPRIADQVLGILKIKPNEAVATSGDYQRYYEAEGKRLHHILDRNTGLPASHAISVTIVADSALYADYYSTLLFLLPKEKALHVLTEHPEIQCIIVDSRQELYISPQLRPRFTTAGAG